MQEGAGSQGEIGDSGKRGSGGLEERWGAGDSPGASRMIHTPAIAAHSSPRVFAGFSTPHLLLFPRSGALHGNSPGPFAKAAASSSTQPQDVPPLLLAQDFGVTRDCLQPPPSTPAACLPYTGTGFGIFVALDWEKAPDQALMGHQHGQKPRLDAWKSQEDSSHPGAKHPRLPTRSLKVPLWHRGAASRLLHFPALLLPCPLAGAQEPFSPRSTLPSSLQLPSSKK